MNSYQLISEILVSKMLRNIAHQAHILIVHKFGLNWNLSALLRKAWTTELNMNLFHKVICWTLYFRQMVGVHLAPHPIWLQWSCHTLSLKSFSKTPWRKENLMKIQTIQSSQTPSSCRQPAVQGWSCRGNWFLFSRNLSKEIILRPNLSGSASCSYRWPPQVTHCQSKHLKRSVIPDFSSCFCFYQLTSFPKSKLVSIGKEDSMENGGHYVNPDVEEGEQAHDAPMLWNRINTWKYSAWNHFISS